MNDLTDPLPPPPARIEGLLTTAQAAAQLGITETALRVRRHRGTAPPTHTIHNGHHYYNPKDLTP